MINKLKNFKWLYPFLITISLYLIFLILFKPSRNTEKNSSIINKRSLKIFVIHLDKKNNNKFKSLEKWIKINDPTLFILGNETYGYSVAINQNKSFFKFISDYNNNDIIYNKSLSSFEYNLNKNLDIAKSIVILELFRFKFPLPIKNNKYLLRNNDRIEYPYLSGLFTNNKVSLKLNNRELKKYYELINNSKKLSNIIIKISFNEDEALYPYISLLQSSGNLELDKLLLKYLYLKIISKEINFNNLRGTEYFFINFNNLKSYR